MSKLSKTILFFIMAIIFSFNYCYGIDLNLTESTTTGNSAQSGAQTTDQSSTSNTQTPASTNTAANTTTTNATSSNNSVAGNSTKQNTSTSTVSSVQNNSNSNSSTITNLINIALIVIGVLLIFFAIAILIRLSNIIKDNSKSPNKIFFCILKSS